MSDTTVALRSLVRIAQAYLDGETDIVMLDAAVTVARLVLELEDQKP